MSASTRGEMVNAPDLPQGIFVSIICYHFGDMDKLVKLPRSDRGAAKAYCRFDSDYPYQVLMMRRNPPGLCSVYQCFMASLYKRYTDAGKVKIINQCLR